MQVLFRSSRALYPQQIKPPREFMNLTIYFKGYALLNPTLCSFFSSSLLHSVVLRTTNLKCSMPSPQTERAISRYYAKDTWIHVRINMKEKPEVS
jgi:hypothetical protein